MLLRAAPIFSEGQRETKGGASACKNRFGVASSHPFLPRSPSVAYGATFLPEEGLLLVSV